MRLLFSQVKYLAALALLLTGCAADRPDIGPDCSFAEVGRLTVKLVSRVPVVDAEMNGWPVQMAIDTGANFTVLNQPSALRIGARADTGLTARLQVAGGSITFGAAQTQTAIIGRVTLRHMLALIGVAGLTQIDGVFGMNMLERFEMDLDLPHNQLTLYRNRTCADKRPNWQKPYERLPTTLGTLRHLQLPVELDGQPAQALIDTGASITAIRRASAARFGTTAEALDTAPGGRVASMLPAGAAFRLLRFDRLKIGQTTIDHPILGAVDLPDTVGDMLIGGDYLTRRRLWIVMSTGEVFVAAKDEAQ